jgi:hypothetical protein
MIRKLLLLLILLGFTMPAAAQQAITFSTVEVDLWPEFDQPEMLVIYHLTLSSEVSLPANVTIQIPTHVGEPHAVAVRQADGALFTVQFQRTVRDQWADISLTATTPDIQLEYYDPNLQKDGNLRTFTFQWPGNSQVDSLLINVQQPFSATNVQIDPALGAGILRSDGLTYYSGDVISYLGSSVFELKISYEKSNDDLSVMDIQVQPSSPIDETITGQSEPVQTYLPWLLGGLGVLLIVGGGVWYWQSGRRQPAKSKPRERRRADAAASQPVLDETNQIYCHQCGKRAGAGDRFCRVCGTRLRSDA